jgi:hypothetical protein
MHDQAAVVSELDPRTDRALRDVLAPMLRHLQPDGLATDDPWREVFEDASYAFAAALGPRRLRLVECPGEVAD